MIDSGVFQMKTVGQLFEKLRRDLAHVKAHPDDSAGWFNFFVTADHLPEWELGNEDDAKDFIAQYALLRICRHLSNNAKHFRARQKKLKDGTLVLSPVASTHEATTAQMHFGPGPTAPPQPRPEFFLQLSDDEGRQIGKGELSALDLAEMLVAFWSKRLQI